MGIKTEFEKACYDEVVRCCKSGETVNGFNFGAKWMADLIAHGKNDVQQAPCPDGKVGCAVYHTKQISRPYTADEIRQLATELGEE